MTRGERRMSRSVCDALARAALGLAVVTPVGATLAAIRLTVTATLPPTPAERPAHARR